MVNIRRSKDLVENANSTKPILYVFKLHMACTLYQHSRLEDAEKVLKKVVVQSRDMSGINDHAAKATLFLGVLSIYREKYDKARYVI